MATANMNPSPGFKLETKYLVLNYLSQITQAAESPRHRAGMQTSSYHDSDLAEDGVGHYDVPDSPHSAPVSSGLWSKADRTRLKLELPQLQALSQEIEEEITPEMEKIRNDIEAVHPPTPQGEVTRMLAEIGDAVNEEYSQIIQKAVTKVTSEQLSLSGFRNAASDLLTGVVPGWGQVALLFSFSRQVAVALVATGSSHMLNIADYTATVIEEKTADFILQQGGWGAVTHISCDDLSSVSPCLSTENNEKSVQ